MTKIQMIVEGGKATPNAQIAQTLGPLKINIGEVISKVNERTASFRGIKVPVEVSVAKDKSYTVSVGSPPAAELLKKEFGLEKGSGMPDKEKIANAAVEQIIKVALMKREGMYVNSLKAAVKTIAGSASSLGILVEGKTGAEFNRDVDAGVYDAEVSGEHVDVAPDKAKRLKEQLVQVQERLRKEQEKLKALAEAAAKPAAEAAAPAAEAAKPGEEKAAEKKPAAEAGGAGKQEAKAAPAKEEKKK